jgi:hypothetical protein
MSTPTDTQSTPAPRGFRRAAPAFALFFMSPFIAEFLLGDFSLDASWLLLVMAPLYGGGALVVREIARRLGLGWPSILLLALAYGLFEEGIVIQTLFNPNYLGLHLLDQAHVPALGIGLWWSAFVLTLHTVWSISVPIALTDSLFAERRNEPWLGKVGFPVAVLLMALGAVMIRMTSLQQDPFAASTAQLTTVWVLIALVVFIALRLSRKPVEASAPAPSAWVVGMSALVLGLAFMNAPRLLQGWPLAGVQVAVDIAAVLVIGYWSRRGGWSHCHILAATGGAMLAYAIMAFPQQPVAGTPGTMDLIGNILFATIGLILFLRALRNTRRSANT